jgi:hypothetical protein
MMKPILVAFLFTTAAKAVVIPENSGNDGGASTKNHHQIESTIQLQENGVVHVPVHRKSLTSSKYSKRQQYDTLRNDLSGYSIQHKSSLPPAIASNHFSLRRNSFTDGGSPDRYWVF